MELDQGVELPAAFRTNFEVLGDQTKFRGRFTSALLAFEQGADLSEELLTVDFFRLGRCDDPQEFLELRTSLHAVSDAIRSSCLTS